MNAIVWLPSAALTLLFFASVLMSRSPTESFVTALVGFCCLSSASVLVSRLLDSSFATLMLLIASAALVPIAWAHRDRNLKISAISLISSVVIFATIVISSQLITRTGGFASIGFTDGVEVLRSAEALQNGAEIPHSAIRGMKRGFALPSMQSMGFEGEYFVGLMPLFFLGALMATFTLIREISRNKSEVAAVSISLFLLFISTEAITRHLYLMNTHSIGWMLVGLLLTQIHKQGRGTARRQDLIVLGLAFTAIGFLRIDYIILFGAFTLYFVLTNAKERPHLSMMVVGAQSVSACAWLTLEIDDFPFLGNIGPIVIAGSGLLATLVLIKLLNRRVRPEGSVVSLSLYGLSVSCGFSLLFLVDISDSVQAVFVNLFLQEGLWGYSISFMLILWIMSRFISPKIGHKFQSIPAICLLTLTLFLSAKYLDGLQLGYEYPSLARVGFGDSLNRTLVSFLPFLVYPMVRVFSNGRPGKSQGVRSRNTIF